MLDKCSLPDTPVSFFDNVLLCLHRFPAAVERARARFRRDVADQLQLAAEKAGLAATVTLDDERAVLEWGATVPDSTPIQVIAAFNEERDAEPGVSDRVSVRVETGEERRTLLTLAWRDDPDVDERTALQGRLAELEARTDERLPLERRGLNASADVRTGRYAKGDVIRQLAGDLKRAAPQALPAPEQSHALVAVERSSRLSWQERRIERKGSKTADGARRRRLRPATSKRNAPM